jgi:2-(1,2-epoxy-1,2-dihydrophenyl)acetyl-CoA isomerase
VTLLDPVAGDALRVETVGTTRWFVVDRPATRNAWTFPMAEQLGVELARAADDPAVAVVVIAGAGGAFSAGLDKAELAQGMSRPSPFPVEALIRFPKATIACVDGPAFGGGATMAMACDLRVVSARGTFSFALGKLGLTPEWGSSYLLWRQIGWSRTLDLYLTGRTVDAEEARRIGIADRLVPTPDAVTGTQALADQIATLPAGVAGAMKAVLRAGLDAGDLDAARAVELRALTRQGAELRRRLAAPP